jgi:hypothetical protein
MIENRYEKVTEAGLLELPYACKIWPYDFDSYDFISGTPMSK